MMLVLMIFRDYFLLSCLLPVFLLHFRNEHYLWFLSIRMQQTCIALFYRLSGTMLKLDLIWCFMPAGDIKQEVGLYREGPTYQRRGSLQLWQFLVALLDDPSNSHFIAWTGRGMEFKLIEPEEVQHQCFTVLQSQTQLKLSAAVEDIYHNLISSMIVNMISNAFKPFKLQMCIFFIICFQD